MEHLTPSQKYIYHLLKKLDQAREASDRQADQLAEQRQVIVSAREVLGDHGDRSPLAGSPLVDMVRDLKASRDAAQTDLANLLSCCCSALGIAAGPGSGELAGARMAEVAGLLRRLVDEEDLRPGDPRGLVGAASDAVSALLTKSESAETLDAALRRLQRQVSEAFGVSCPVKDPGIGPMLPSWDGVDRLATAHQLLLRLAQHPGPYDQGERFADLLGAAAQRLKYAEDRLKYLESRSWVLCQLIGSLSDAIGLIGIPDDPGPVTSLLEAQRRLILLRDLLRDLTSDHDGDDILEAATISLKRLREGQDQAAKAVGELKRLQSAVQEWAGLSCPAPGIGPTLADWPGWAELEADRPKAPTAYVTSRGRTRLPDEVVEALGLRGGGGVVYYTDPGKKEARMMPNEQFLERIEPASIVDLSQVPAGTTLVATKAIIWGSIFVPQGSRFVLRGVDDLTARITVGDQTVTVPSVVYARVDQGGERPGGGQ